MTVFGTAEDFGLKGFKNVMLSVGGCASPDYRHKGPVAPYFMNYNGPVAHTHCCQRDPFFKYICIPKWAIKTTKGEPTSIFWHEYGHFLDPKKHLDCSEHGKEFEGKYAALEAQSWLANFNIKIHGDSFKETMAKLGKPELSVATFDFTKEPFKSEGLLYEGW